MDKDHAREANTPAPPLAQKPTHARVAALSKSWPSDGNGGGIRRSGSYDSLPEDSNPPDRVIVAAPDSAMSTFIGHTSTRVLSAHPDLEEEIKHLRQSKTIPNVVTMGGLGYEPTKETDKQLVVLPSISSFQAYVNVKKAIIGITVFTLPHCCRMTGMGTVASVLTVVTLGCMVSNHQLINVRRLLKEQGKAPRDASYITVAAVGCGGGWLGRLVAVFVSLCLVATGIGNVVGFIDFITAMVRDFGHSIGLEHAHLRFWVPVAFGLIETPMAIQRSMVLITHANIVAFMAFILASILVAANLGYDVYKFGLPGHYEVVRIQSSEYMIDTVGKAIYIMTFHQCLYPLVSAMRRPGKAKVVNDTALSTSLLLCIAYGMVGYMILGRRSEEVLFDSLSVHSVAIACKVLIAIEGLACFPLTIICAREVVESVVVDGILVRFDAVNVPRLIAFTRAGTRLCVLGLCVLLSILVPEFSKAVDIVAGIPVCFLCLALPALLDALVRKPGWFVYLLNILLFVFWCAVGAALTTAGVYHTIMQSVPVKPVLPAANNLAPAP